MIVRNLNRQSIIAKEVRIADNPLSRMCGLLGTENMKEGQALLIKPCQSVHMFFMRFAIDVIFLDKENQVVGLCHELKPNKLSPVFFKSACALELPTGTINLSFTQIGDRIDFGIHA